MNNHTLAVLFALIIGFFIGIGVSYTATNAVIEMQARKVASVAEAAVIAKTECSEKLMELARKKAGR